MTWDEKPLISVLFPMLDFDENFYTALHSILAQTFGDFEVVVLYPNETKIPEKQSLGDERIKLYSCPSSWNLSRTLNFGLRISKGELIARMDSDDIANEFRFENQIKYLNENKHVSICGTWAELFGGESYSFKPSERWDRLRVDSLFGCQFIHPTVMFKRQTVFEHSLFYDESLSATEDFDLWARWIEVSPMANVPKSLLLYRRHSSSATHRNKEIGETIYLRTMAHLLRRGGFMVDDSEVMIHFKAFNAKEISLFEYELLKSTFERLILWNRSRKFYSDHYLEASIKDRLGQLKSHLNF